MRHAIIIAGPAIAFVLVCVGFGLTYPLDTNPKALLFICLFVPGVWVLMSSTVMAGLDDLMATCPQPISRDCQAWLIRANRRAKWWRDWIPKPLRSLLLATSTLWIPYLYATHYQPVSLEQTGTTVNQGKEYRELVEKYKLELVDSIGS